MIIALLGLAVLVGVVTAYALWKIPTNPAAYSIQRLQPYPGDVMLVRVGIDAQAMGETGPWIPGPNELADVADLFDHVVPEGVKVIVTHIGVNAEVHPMPQLIMIDKIDDDEVGYAGTD